MKPTSFHEAKARSCTPLPAHIADELCRWTLRSYLRYRATRGDQVCKLSAVILNPVHWKLASLPRALKPEDVGHLLDAVAVARLWPKRRYAIVRLALDMGLRSGEIAQLMISDVDWRAGTATLRGTKSLRQDVLPLPVETGLSLADYHAT